MSSRQVRKKPSKSLTQGGSTEQGCSHWADRNSHKVERSVVDGPRDVIEALPSPSQVSENTVTVGLNRAVLTGRTGTTMKWGGVL